MKKKINEGEKFTADVIRNLPYKTMSLIEALKISEDKWKWISSLTPGEIDSLNGFQHPLNRDDCSVCFFEQENTYPPWHFCRKCVLHFVCSKIYRYGTNKQEAEQLYLAIRRIREAIELEK